MREVHLSLGGIIPQPDREIQAIKAVAAALATLDDAARGRVIDWAFARYVESVSASENSAPVPASNTPEAYACKHCGETIYAVACEWNWKHIGGTRDHAASPIEPNPNAGMRINPSWLVD